MAGAEGVDATFENLLKKLRTSVRTPVSDAVFRGELVAEGSNVCVPGTAGSRHSWALGAEGK